MAISIDVRNFYTAIFNFNGSTGVFIMSKMFQVYGIGQALIPVLPPPLPFQNAPTSNQTGYEIGQVVYTPPKAPTAFYFYGGGGNWIKITDVNGPVLSVTGTANQILASPTSGDVVLSLIGPYTPATYTAHGVLIGEGSGSIVATAAGTAGQFLVSGGASADPTWTTATFPTTAGAAGTILRSNGTNYVASTDTWPDTVVAGDILIATATNVVGSLADVATGQVLMSGGVGVAPAYSGSPSVSGSLTAGTSVTATLGNITATNGNIVKGTAGNKDIYTSVASTTTAGANSAGTVTLAGGTATIATTAVTASSLIRLSRQSVGSTGAAATGNLSIGTITASTSFVINAVSAADATALAATDVSVVFWEIVN
jgi:hypothetical protein